MSVADLYAYQVRTYNLTPEQAKKWNSDYIGTAGRFPRELWDNPAVEECIWFLVTADKLQLDLSVAEVRREGKYWVSPSDNEVFADQVAKEKEPESQDTSEERFRPANADIAVTSYGVAEVLMRCVCAILEDGISGQKTGKDYIKEKANVALGYYGLRVVTEHEVIDNNK